LHYILTYYTKFMTVTGLVSTKIKSSMASKTAKKYNKQALPALSKESAKYFKYLKEIL